MTASFPLLRTVSQKLLPTSSETFTRLSTNSALRVACTCATNLQRSRSRHDFVFPSYLLAQRRTYAAGLSKKPVGRPKAPKGRPSTKRTSTTSSSKKSGKKTAAKKAKKRAAKPKVKPRKKKVLSESGRARQAAQKRTELRKTALLRGPPKKLPETAYQLLFVQEAPKKGSVATIDGSHAKAASARYKSLSPEEHEHLNREATENKAKNEAAYKDWVQGYTPLQIKQANHARDLLKQQARAAGKKTLFAHIQDDRTVKGPRNAYAYYLQARVSSGDLKGITVAEVGKLVAKEWKELSTLQKQPYEDTAKADKNRYLEEYKTAYGVDSPSLKKAS